MGCGENITCEEQGGILKSLTALCVVREKSKAPSVLSYCQVSPRMEDTGNAISFLFNIKTII
jgi:hypothetical protein